MIRELGRSISNAVLENIGRAASRVQEQRPIPVDLLESEDAYLAVFDAPGATSSDIQVRFDEDRIEVRIDRFRNFHEGFEMRAPGRGLSLDGHVTLPVDAAVDPETATATATLKQNGTLHVQVPKSDDAATMSVSEESDVETADSNTEAGNEDTSDENENENENESQNGDESSESDA